MSSAGTAALPSTIVISSATTPNKNAGKQSRRQRDNSFSNSLSGDLHRSSVIMIPSSEAANVTSPDNLTSTISSESQNGGFDKNNNNKSPQSLSNIAAQAHFTSANATAPHVSTDCITVLPNTITTTTVGADSAGRAAAALPHNNNNNHTLLRTIYTAGRPPWYSARQGGPSAPPPFVIGVCGGSASGKTTVATKIISALSVPWVSLLSMDSFYNVLSAEQRAEAHRGNFNFDHPNAFDMDLLVETLARLRKHKSVEIPVYDFTTHSRLPHRTKRVYGANVIILEGIMVFAERRLLDLMDLKVFVECDADERLGRRMMRDIAERGRQLDEVLHQYEKFVKPSYEQFIAPSMGLADLIIPRGGQESQTALKLITRLVRAELDKRENKLRPVQAAASQQKQHPHQSSSNIREAEEEVANALASSGSHAGNSSEEHIEQLKVLPSNNQVLGLWSIIRSRETRRDDLIFYSNRLMRLLIEFALSFLPHQNVELRLDASDDLDSANQTTNMGGGGDGTAVDNASPSPSPSPSHTSKNNMAAGKCVYAGRRVALSSEQLCAVSIMRAGETMETALSAVWRDIKIGKLLIQTNAETHEPELHYMRLPRQLVPVAVPPTNSTCNSSSNTHINTDNTTISGNSETNSNANANKNTQSLSHVLLMDATISTGAAAIMAIRVLLDHEVAEERIIFVALLASQQGIRNVAYNYPGVQIVVAAVDPLITQDYHIVPGLGNFGDRYFGTDWCSSSQTDIPANTTVDTTIQSAGDSLIDCPAASPPNVASNVQTPPKH